MSVQRKITPADYPARVGTYQLPACRWCHRTPTPPRKTFCSDGCVHEYRLRSDVKYLRAYMFSRDKGVCASCGTDTLALSRQLSELTEEARKARCKLLGIPWSRGKPGGSLWDGDHVLPVAQGGGPSREDYLSNLQTLCISCHRRKTAADRKRFS